MLPPPKMDEVTTPPTIQGSRARAWLVDLNRSRETWAKAPKPDATLAMWVIEAPWAHPVWHSFLVVLIHMRPMPDQRPTKIYLAGATHEMWLLAMNPDEPRQPAIEGVGPPHYLTPPNYASQFISESDDVACERVRRAVAMVTEGNLNPDEDYRWWWARLFGDNMMKDRASPGPAAQVLDGDGKPIVTVPAIMPPPGWGT